MFLMYQETGYLPEWKELQEEAGMLTPQGADDYMRLSDERICRMFHNIIGESMPEAPELERLRQQSKETVQKMLRQEP